MRELAPQAEGNAVTMRRNTTGFPAHGAARLWRLMLRLGVGVSILLALLLLFEVGIRHVPPDGMIVAYEYGPTPSGPMRATYAAPQDQQIINAYYAALNDAPAYHSLQPNYVQTTRDGCYLSTYPQFTFTWHGIPLESWSGYCAVVENAGGIPDDLMFTYHLWTPPTSGAMPPPASR